MFRKIVKLILAVLILINACGCFAIFAGGVVGGTGTAVWLSGKMVQQVDYSIERTSRATRDALSSLGLSITSKENLIKGFAQFRSYDKAREKVWVDVFRVSQRSSQIQVRVGTFTSNKESASRILNLIIQNLGG